MQISQLTGFCSSSKIAKKSRSSSYSESQRHSSEAMEATGLPCCPPVDGSATPLEKNTLPSKSIGKMCNSKTELANMPHRFSIACSMDSHTSSKRKKKKHKSTLKRDAISFDSESSIRTLCDEAAKTHSKHKSKEKGCRTTENGDACDQLHVSYSKDLSEYQRNRISSLYLYFIIVELRLFFEGMHVIFHVYPGTSHMGNPSSSR